jgi:hypothetical protein
MSDEEDKSENKSKDKSKNKSNKSKNKSNNKNNNLKNIKNNNKSNFDDIIKSSISYYDTNQEKYKNKIATFKYYKTIKSNSDLESSSIQFFDINKKLIFTSKYQVMCIYDNVHKLFVWSWAVPRYTQSETTLSTRVLQYGFSLDTEKILLKTDLITSKQVIESRILLDVNVAIASYLTKMPFIYELQVSYDILEQEEEENKVNKDNLFELNKKKYNYGDDVRYLSTFMYLLNFEE